MSELGLLVMSIEGLSLADLEAYEEALQEECEAVRSRYSKKLGAVNKAIIAAQEAEEPQEGPTGPERVRAAIEADRGGAFAPQKRILFAQEETDG